MVASSEATLYQNNLENIIDTNNNENISNISITEFYENASIFVTGGTGFLGKVLIEKLLYSCKDIRQIFVLLRPKRGLSSEERYKEFMKNSVFGRIHSKDELILNKLVCISGDIDRPNLGLSDHDMELVTQKTSIVFHVAATVKFNESLKEAANLNTIGTQRLLDLCLKMRNLKSFVHVSTAYSNPERTNVGETVYISPEPMTKETFLKCVNVLPTEVINSVADVLQGTHPNTYTLTKSMAEQIVSDYAVKFPICIIRPSIVTASIEEPFPGWVDNIYGITGIMMEIGRGTISSIIAEENKITDLVPVDIVCNTMIAAAWSNHIRASKTVSVYNCTSGQINPVTWKEYGNITVKYARMNPTKYVVMYPGFSYRTNKFVHCIIRALYHFLPAYIFDVILRARGAKPMMYKIAKRLDAAAYTGEFFAMHEWIFDNDNYRKLMSDVKADPDGAEFNCDMSCMDWDDYVKKYMNGIRKFVLKDEMESMAGARSKITRLYWLKKVTQAAIVGVIYKIFIHGWITL